jgi:hypothetical protein
MNERAVFVVNVEEVGRCPECLGLQRNLKPLWKYKGDGRWQTEPRSKTRRIAGIGESTEARIEEASDVLGAWEKLLKETTGIYTKL